MIDRRGLLAASSLMAAPALTHSAVAATTDTCGPGVSAATPSGGKPRTYVLVHGGFHGGWCWERVAGRLVGAGHRVFTPTQTGLGERKHLMSPDITLDTFVEDVTNVIEANELKDVYLVGHSFGGRTVTGVTDRMPDRIARLVLLDTGYLVSGKSALDAMKPADRNERIRLSRSSGDGMSMAVPKATVFGLTAPEDLAWVARRMRPQPFSTYNTALTLHHPVGNGRPVTYIRCIAPRYSVVDSGEAYARAQPDWQVLELPSGHDAMVILPGPLTDMLLGLV